MSHCIFCKIVNKEIPSNPVFESEQFIAFHDLNPQAKVHILIIPKKHFHSLNDCSEDTALLGGLVQTVTQVAKILGLDQLGYRTVINTLGQGGQTVFHLHAHLLGGEQLAGRFA